MIQLNKKTFFILIIIILSIFLIACGGKEIDSLGIVISMGFDKEDGEIITTNEIINPMSKSKDSSSSTGENTYFVRSRGKTITDAINNARLTFDRQLYFPHNRLFIIGEEVTKDGLDGPLDFLARDNEQREEAYIVVAKETSAYNVMGINAGLSDSSGKYIYEMMKEKVTSGKSRALTISDFFKYYYREKQGYTLGIVEVIEKETINKEKEKGREKVLSIEGGAVFKNNKLIGYFNGNEMLGFNLLVDELETAIIVFNSPEEVTEGDGELAKTDDQSSFEIFKSSTKKRVEIVDGSLHLYMDVEMRGGLVEVHQGLNISEEGVLKTMERACGDRVKSLMTDTLDKAKKEYNIDTFGIATLLYNKYPKLWNQIEDDWPSIFKDLDYTINVEVSFNDTGYTNTPTNIRKDKHEK